MGNAGVAGFWEQLMQRLDKCRVDSLIAIKEADDNRFFYSQKEDFSDDFDDSTSEIFNPEYLRRKKRRLEEIRLVKLSKIDTEK